MNTLPMEYLDLKSKKSASLLRDNKGVYGIHVKGTEMVNGVPPENGVLIARPDKVSEHTTPGLFHAIPKGVPGYARRANEVMLYWKLCETFHKDAGLVPFPDKPDAEYRRHYHAAKSRAVAMVNALLNELYAEAVPAEYLRVIRRYAPTGRSRLYPALCKRGPRAFQLADVFPVLAWFIYEKGEIGSAEVQKGVKLPIVAAMAGVPSQMRVFPPAVLGDVLTEAGNFLASNPRLIAHAPPTVPKMRQWLKAIRAALPDEDYAAWIAKHGMEMGHWRAMPELAGDVSDWVTACKKARLAEQIKADDVHVYAELLGFNTPHAKHCLKVEQSRAAAVSRPFNAEMAPRTALALSDEWHEAISQLDGSVDVAFPAPWANGGESKGYAIEPIETAPDLMRAARTFRNCSATYDSNVARGECYLYTVQQDGAPVAMLELVRNVDKAEIGQLKGLCNKPVSKAVNKAVRAWFRDSKCTLPKPPANPLDAIFGEGAAALVSDGVPF